MDKSYRISRTASRIISEWSRLRHINLQDVDLFVLGSNAISDDMELWRDEPSAEQSQRRFFFGLGGKVSLASTAYRSWNIRWIVIASKTVNSFDVGWKNLPHQLVARDKTLQRKRVKSATIVVANEAVREMVSAQIQELKEELRGPLRVVCATS